MTGDIVEKDRMTGKQFSDLEAASMVRMLCRNDLNHEFVCLVGRDRIMYLSQRVEELEGINKILVKGQTEDQPGPWVQRAFEALAAAKGTVAELERAIAVIREASDYLDTNNLTNIGHGSLLHAQFKAVLMESV